MCGRLPDDPLIPALDSEDFSNFLTGLSENTDIGSMIMDSFVKQESQLQPQQLQPQQQQVPVPDLSHLSRIPNLETVQSRYEFEVTVPPDVNIAFNREKLFIKKGTKMTMNVAYQPQYRGEPLFVRAMLLFSKPAEMHLPVKCCANHRNPATANPDWKPEQLSEWANIVKINDPKAEYKGLEEGLTFRDRLSITVPLESTHIDENGKIMQSIGLEFGCQNSCSSGINRRPVLIVFTLEAANFEVLGKCAIEFKVCSCPKRDAEREQTERKRKNAPNVAFPRGKRPTYQPSSQTNATEVKTEPDSESDDSTNNDLNLTNITVDGMQFSYPTALIPELLKSAHDKVAGKMAEDSKRSTDYGQMGKVIKELKKLRKRFE